MKADVMENRLAARVAALGWAGAVLPHPKARRGDVYHGIGVGLHHLGLLR